jgi:hypothetical protein
MKTRLSTHAVLSLDKYVRNFRTLAENEANRIAQSASRPEATPDDLEKAVTKVMESLIVGNNRQM